MGFISRLTGVDELKKIIQDLEKKQSGVEAIIINSTYGTPAKSYGKYEDYVNEAYFKNSVVADCLNYICKAVGGIDWFSVRKNSEGIEEEVEGSEFTKLINHPNPFVKGRAEFFKEWILYLYLSGNEYMQRAPLGKSKVIKELWNLRPDRMTIEKGTAEQRVKEYLYTINGVVSTPHFQPDEIMHIRFLNPLDDWYGITPLKSIEYEIDQVNEAQLWNLNLLQKGAMPPGVMLIKKTLQKEQKKAIQDSLAESTGGGKNAGKWMVIDNASEVTAERWGYSPIAMQWLDGLIHNAVQIALALGVPPELIGIQGQKTYSNYKEARKSFYEETILPLMDWIQESLNSFLSSYFKGEELRYDKDDIEALAEDRSSKYVDAVAGWNAGLLKRNEARDLMQQESIEGDVGDEFKPTPSGGFGAMSNKRKLELKTLAGIDIETEEQKDMYWKSQENDRNKWIEVIKNKIHKRLEEEKIEIVEAVKNDKKPEDGIDEDKWLETLKYVYLTIGTEFAQSQIGKLKSIYPLETKAFDEALFTARMLKYFNKVGMKKVKQIKDTVREICKAELTEGVKLGEGIPQLANRIKDKIEEIIPNRATVIARTETIQAANAGNHYGAVESELDLTKKWLTVRDGKERDWHGEVDGQERDFEEPYDVPNGEGQVEQLMFPLDSSLGASGSNIIQCRCVEIYHKREGV
jgi:HK97 family phage portal protein